VQLRKHAFVEINTHCIGCKVVCKRVSRSEAESAPVSINDLDRIAEKRAPQGDAEKSRDLYTHSSSPFEWRVKKLVCPQVI